MNVDLVIVRPLSLSVHLYNNSPSNSRHRPFQSSHASSVPLTSPLFSLPRHHKKLSISVITACIDTSQLSQHPNGSQNDEHAYREYVKHCRPPGFPDRVSCVPLNGNQVNSIHTAHTNFEDHDDDVWLKIQDEARSDVEQEPILSSYYFTSILSHKSLESALACHLSIKLSSLSLQSGTLFDLFMGVLVENQEIIQAVKADLRAVKERDPACTGYVHSLLSFKGFLALQAHRIAHRLWLHGRKVLALLIQNRVSEVCSVDIHPGARIGNGIMLDHATGVVIGETAVIGDNVSILHNVTLGGTGKMSGDRHPKIGNGVLIGAGTCILGNIKIGDGAKIGAGSVVLKEIPPRTTAVGNPAKLIGGKENPIRLDKIPSFTMDQTSHIYEWSDYVI